jgi:TRAP transporter 4TM/12TM fusion protein
MTEGWRRPLNIVLAALLCLFTLSEVNYPRLAPQSQLAIFSGLGLVLCFLNQPLHRRWKDQRWLRAFDLLLALLAIACCTFVVVQTEPLFEGLWLGGQSLGNRAGQETSIDTVVGLLGLLLVIEATRRTIGSALPALALLFIAYAVFGASLPGWLFPHRGYGVERIVAQTFLHSQGVFGTALRVMFTYVFLFVILGALLRQTGATRFIIDFARRIFGGVSGGPAKVSVLSSGMMGSLSGSAVANTATTGTFTIPMMRSAGFRPEIAAGVEAAASSGGALVPPVMGAGAYMMLEIVEPPVTYLQIIKAALIPAMLYYLSLFLIVHFYARRVGATSARDKPDGPDKKEEVRGKRTIWEFEGAVFLSGFVGLILLLILGYTVFRAVSIALGLIVVVSSLHPRTRLTPRRVVEALVSSGRDVIPLISAAACVGIVIGVVTLTGVGTKLPSTILTLAQGNLLGALALIMISSIILGMGLPSAVCYLLMATLIGSVLADLGVVPLGAHLFIFYFGMMSMVTPPVALAAYAAASIAGSGIMRTGLAAFRFALVGFTLPYMFVLRPSLLMLDNTGSAAAALDVVGAVVLAVLGIVPFAAGIAGYLFTSLSPALRLLLFAASALLLLPGGSIQIGGVELSLLGIGGLVLLAGAAVSNWNAAHQARSRNR